ncbi:hypothetical protein [Rhodococcus sp. NPDC049939]|uniref:hypothetical protein n=1 Tax=Rhodococcus sp. NPDC049939 TaxID=3155511 RepID=UPI0033DE131B
MRAIVLALLACLAVAACGPVSNTDELTAPPEVTSAEGPTRTMPQARMPRPSEVPDQEFGTVFVPRPDIVQANPTPFESWSRTEGDNIAIHFVTGTPACYGADATVVETDSSVNVSLRTGILPEAADKMCTLVAVFATMEIQLQQPLGDREVIDGTP